MSPKQGEDQLMHRWLWKGNLTKKQYEKLQQGGSNKIEWYELEMADHWSRWNANAHNRAKEFWHKSGLLRHRYTKVTEAEFPTIKPSGFRRFVLPVLI